MLRLLFLVHHHHSNHLTKSSEEPDPLDAMHGVVERMNGFSKLSFLTAVLNSVTSVMLCNLFSSSMVGSYDWY